LDVEACAGTHLASTLEVGFVKIVLYRNVCKMEFERLGYAVGLEALKSVQKQESLVWKNFRSFDCFQCKSLIKTAEKIVKTQKVNVRNVN